ncbi:hypothetical protein [Jatrophihabitans endophyticus]|uniref:hypothetical protein n=1 Tax=Jatrophihabitans endophyticus TaxID=1206085 RepID=UPI0019FA927A|nr:hypothetical protein [Jatrophihabitans endophyticus]MBE7186871.1 hypothetical protein [Jatrophihabitans endophyticus]
MPDETPRPHRPARFADLTEIIDAAGGAASPSARAEIAAATAEAVVQAGRSPDDASELVDLADRIGLDTLAALWRDADPVSLPGALWALYVLRQWCRTDADEVTRLWRAGEPLAPAEAAVAGVADFADADAVRAVADAVLTGAYRGDFAVALERAAAFFRVVAAGRRSAAVPAPEGGPADAADPTAPGELAERNERAARSLSAAASRWRAGTLH